MQVVASLKINKTPTHLVGVWYGSAIRTVGGGHGCLDLRHFAHLFVATSLPVRLLALNRAVMYRLAPAAPKRTTLSAVVGALDATVGLAVGGSSGVGAAARVGHRGLWHVPGHRCLHRSAKLLQEDDKVFTGQHLGARRCASESHEDAVGRRVSAIPPAFVERRKR